MTPYNQILMLHLHGLNNSEIARKTACSRGTVIDVIKRAKRAGFSFLEGETLSDVEIHRMLHPPIRKQAVYKAPDMGPVIFLTGMPKQSIAKIWKAYAKECIDENKKAYSKSAFQGFIRDLEGQYRKEAYRSDLCCTRLIVNGIRILYVEVSYSNYAIAVVLNDDKPRTWIQANRKILRSIGKAPKTYKYVGHLPKPFADETKKFANFYEMKFTSIKNPLFGDWLCDNLNTKTIDTSIQRAINELCNQRNIQALYPFSHFNHIDALELQKQTFNSLPADMDYETCEIRHPVVQMNFHVELEGKYYSVPFELRHERITANITDASVILYQGDELICVHNRIANQNQLYSTYKEHMPVSDDEIPWSETSGRSLRSWAKHIGFAVFRVVDIMLKRETYEPCAFKTCTALIQLAKTYGDKTLNVVCKEVIRDKHNRISLKLISTYCEGYFERDQEHSKGKAV